MYAYEGDKKIDRKEFCPRNFWDKMFYFYKIKKKCLKNLQQFYKKYGCDKIEILRTYLTSLCETLEDPKEIEELKKELRPRWNDFIIPNMRKELTPYYEICIKLLERLNHE